MPIDQQFGSHCITGLSESLGYIFFNSTSPVSKAFSAYNSIRMIDRLKDVVYI
jgi:hypothetical protein